MNSKSIQKNALFKQAEFKFTVPPDAPIFQPTPEEFMDPFGYISKIRPIAEKSGICKIIPPSRWQPPFSLDVDKFKFVPRIQKLNELDAITRLKLLFVEKIFIFWELQGSPLKIPLIENKPLDLYCLKFWVDEGGGFEKCNTTKQWPHISNVMGYSQNISTMYYLKNSYEKILLPYVKFEKNKAINLKPVKKAKQKIEIKEEDENLLITKVPKQSIKNPTEIEPDTVIIDANPLTNIQKTGSDNKPDNQTDNKPENEFDNQSDNKPGNQPDITRTKSETRRFNYGCRELQRLACYGPGPKMPALTDEETKLFTLSQRKRPRYDLDPLSIYQCVICHKDQRDDLLIFCNGCSVTYHTFCLKPPLDSLPDEWQCSSCIAEHVRKPAEAYGFAQAEKEYTLLEFGDMADKFKSDYFGISGHLVPTTVVEKEFWRIISRIEEDVTVEYGADLHSMDHGSGFPTKASLNLYPADQEYVDSGWNLNNLPVKDGSVLKFINGDISGMTVPWMYVGMCFAAFCWHNEDHWSYSINYLHWGETKTWYGVPGSSAELLENTMKAAAPDLFESQPDLLHQLVTTMNPNILMDAGVPVCKIDQNAGEFVVTFPRAYHTGFNHGYNFAEAVNFAPPDWLKIGRQCISHYKNIKRYCVFSHDELVCKIALDGDRLDLATALGTQNELVKVSEEEDCLRTMLTKKGITNMHRTAFELLGDDERLCEVCKTTCFLSSIACSTCKHMVCLQHADDLCQCSTDKKTLHFRYDMDEIKIMLQTVDFRVCSYDKWMSQANNILNPNTPKVGKIQKIKELLNDAEELSLPICPQLTLLKEEYAVMTKNMETVIIEIDDD